MVGTAHALRLPLSGHVCCPSTAGLTRLGGLRAPSRARCSSNNSQHEVVSLPHAFWDEKSVDHISTSSRGVQAITFFTSDGLVRLQGAAQTPSKVKESRAVVPCWGLPFSVASITVLSLRQRTDVRTSCRASRTYCKCSHLCQLGKNRSYA